MCPTELYLHDNVESKSILIKTSLLSLQYIKLKLNERDKLCNVPWRLNTQGSKFESYGPSFEKKALPKGAAPGTVSSDASAHPKGGSDIHKQR